MAITFDGKEITTARDAAAVVTYLIHNFAKTGNDFHKVTEASEALTQVAREKPELITEATLVRLLDLKIAKGKGDDFQRRQSGANYCISCLYHQGGSYKVPQVLKDLIPDARVEKFIGMFDRSKDRGTRTQHLAFMVRHKPHLATRKLWNRTVKMATHDKDPRNRKTALWLLGSIAAANPKAVPENAMEWVFKRVRGSRVLTSDQFYAAGRKIDPIRRSLMDARNKKKSKLRIALLRAREKKAFAAWRGLEEQEKTRARERETYYGLLNTLARVQPHKINAPKRVRVVTDFLKECALREHTSQHSRNNGLSGEHLIYAMAAAAVCTPDAAAAVAVDELLSTLKMEAFNYPQQNVPESLRELIAKRQALVETRFRSYLRNPASHMETGPGLTIWSCLIGDRGDKLRYSRHFQRTDAVFDLAKKILANEPEVASFIADRHWSRGTEKEGPSQHWNEAIVELCGEAVRAKMPKAKPAAKAAATAEAN